MLVWLTGSAGVGKSTVCEALREQGVAAVDADWDGYNHWFDRRTGEVIVDPPDPVPEGWLDRYGWQIEVAMVESLALDAEDRVVVLCGTVENEVDVWGLFDLVICLVVDDQTLIDRLAARTTNSFGKHAEELAAVLKWNQSAEATYRESGAEIIDADAPLESVVDAILALVEEAVARS